MNQLLFIEWLKLRKYRTFWVLVTLFLILLPLWHFGITKGLVSSTGSSNNDQEINLFKQINTFQYVWANLGYWASLFVVFTTILISIITTNEYSFKTNRQNIIDGLSRQQFYHSKWMLVFLFSAVTTLYVFVLGIIFGTIDDKMQNFPGDLTSLLHFFVLCLNYYAFGLLLAILIKRSGLAIVLFILYFFIETLFQGIINYLTKSKVGNFLPLQSSDQLLPNPISNMLKTFSGVIEEGISDWYYLIASLAWILIYYLIGRYRILKSDW